MKLRLICAVLLICCVVFGQETAVGEVDSLARLSTSDVGLIGKALSFWITEGPVVPDEVSGVAVRSQNEGKYLATAVCHTITYRGGLGEEREVWVTFRRNGNAIGFVGSGFEVTWAPEFPSVERPQRMKYPIKYGLHRRANEIEYHITDRLLRRLGLRASE